MTDSKRGQRINKPVNVRDLAVDVLIRIMDKKEYSDKVLHEVLEKYSRLEKRDRAFLTRLVEGTTERCIEIDYMIEHFSKTGLSKMKPAIRALLRISVYQIMYMDQVPDSAVCNEAVNIAAMRKLGPLKAFVNGVLRNVVRYHEDVPYPQKNKDIVAHYSIWYSMPKWIVKRFLDSYGEKRTESILQSFYREHPDTVVRCNLTEHKPEEIRDSLLSQKVTVRDGKLYDEAFHLSDYGRLQELEAFEKGWIQVQDESSMVVGNLAEVTPESIVIDVCAAPGGKALHIADRMQQKGLIHACDISEDKVKLIRQNLIRTGIHNVKLKKQDARKLREEWVGTADVVIADLPCSGLGVMGKKCDIKYLTHPEDVLALAELQKKILSVVSQYVKPGGMLIFSTCTIAEEENQQNVQWILKNLPFTAVDIEEKLPQKLQGLTGKEGYLQILPDMAETDGFFVSVFRRKN